MEGSEQNCTPLKISSLQDENTDNTENVDKTELDIEVNCLRVGQIVAVHLKGKKIDTANVYMAMVSAC